MAGLTDRPCVSVLIPGERRHTTPKEKGKKKRSLVRSSPAPNRNCQFLNTNCWLRGRWACTAISTHTHIKIHRHQGFNGTQMLILAILIIIRCWIMNEFPSHKIPQRLTGSQSSTWIGLNYPLACMHNSHCSYMAIKLSLIFWHCKLDDQ